MSQDEKKPKPTLAEKIAKLPGWAQEHIKDLERTRDVAEMALNQYEDNQTKSEFSIQEFTNGKFITRYIQTDKIDITAHGLHVTVRVGYDREKKISIEWGCKRELGTYQVAFVPTSFQKADIIAKENMR